MPLPGKTKPKLENKSMPLPAQNQKVSDNPPLYSKKKIVNVGGVRPPAKITPLSSIKYLTIK